MFKLGIKSNGNGGNAVASDVGRAIGKAIPLAAPGKGGKLDGNGIFFTFIGVLTAGGKTGNEGEAPELC